MNLPTNTPLESAKIPNNNDLVPQINDALIQEGTSNETAALIQEGTSNETSTTAANNTTSSSSSSTTLVLCREVSTGKDRSGNESESEYISSLWLRLVQTLKKYNADDLKNAKLREMFPAEDCEDLTDPEWRRIVLRKVKKHTWELLDES